MPGPTCNACNKEFVDDVEQKLRYKSEWHRYNLKRKVAGVSGVKEALFLARQSALAQEKDKQNETPILYSCGLCGKGYRSSRLILSILSHGPISCRLLKEPITLKISMPLSSHFYVAVNKPPQPRDRNDEESEDEWVEVDQEEDLVDQDTIESCMVRKHEFHGFIIPDVEYLKDPEGLLTNLGLKVKRDFMCLYCNEWCLPFTSLEAVRKHMATKGHCKVHFGDGDEDEDEDAELEEFYDYSSSYVDESRKQLVTADDIGNIV